MPRQVTAAQAQLQVASQAQATMEQEAAASMWGELKMRKAEIERLQSSGAPAAQIERAKAELCGSWVHT